jgi:hypothetical protein
LVRKHSAEGVHKPPHRGWSASPALSLPANSPRSTDRPPANHQPFFTITQYSTRSHLRSHPLSTKMRTTIAISAAALLLSPRLVAAAPMPASAYSGAGGSANGGSVTSDSSSGPAVDGLGFLPDALGVFSTDGAGSSSSSSSTSSDGKLLSANLLGNDVLGGDVLGHGKGLLGHDAVGDGLLGGHLLG